MTETIIGTLDLAQVSLYLFFIFFAGLVVYLQMENQREGYPLENDKGEDAAGPGLFPLPRPKTFKLPHGRGEITVPNGASDRHRKFAMEQVTESGGAPFTPTGDPLVDGIGPAAWAERRDVPELDGHGNPKIVPMRHAKSFAVSAGRDPRGLPVQAADHDVVGSIKDMWVDESEQLVRYLEIDLNEGAGSRLVPIQLTTIHSDRVLIRSLHGHHFPKVPKTKAATKVTLLEEEKICAYYCGGKLYASDKRLGPIL